MQRVTLLCVGKLKEPWARDAAELYLQRLRAGFDLTVLELAPSHGRSEEQQRAEESERILKMLPSLKGEVWILDETGKDMTSQQFSATVTHAKDAGTSLLFVLGGAYGFTDAVRKAGRPMRLSAMTLPHELCRIVFLEQLYRAQEIAKGSGYHH